VSCVLARVVAEVHGDRTRPAEVLDRTGVEDRDAHQDAPTSVGDDIRSDMLASMGPELVREARKRAGLTQAELARRVGTSQPAIARIEAGRSQPSFDRVVELLRACGFDLLVHLEPAEASDWAQARELLGLTPDERVAQNAAGLAFADELRAAYREAVGA
jgi:transcriptional regulator with XRE-family HTH domain